jgi:hypothetical protein
MDFEKIGFVNVRWIELVQDLYQCRLFVSSVESLGSYYLQGICVGLYLSGTSNFSVTFSFFNGKICSLFFCFSDSILTGTWLKVIVWPVFGFPGFLYYICSWTRNLSECWFLLLFYHQNSGTTTVTVFALFSRHTRIVGLASAYRWNQVLKICKHMTE